MPKCYFALRFVTVAFVSNYKSAEQNEFDEKVIGFARKLNDSSNNPREIERVAEELNALMEPYYRGGIDSIYKHMPMKGWTCQIQAPHDSFFETTSVEKGERPLLAITSCSNDLGVCALAGGAEFELQFTPSMAEKFPKKLYKGDVLQFSGEGFFTSIAGNCGGYKADVLVDSINVIQQSK